MSFPHNNFLTGASSEADVAVTEILETYFRKDGSIAMTGILNVGNDTVLGVKNIELNNQVSGSQPVVGQINIYSKIDKKLYMKDSDNKETDLTSSGIGDVVGPGSSVSDNLSIFSDNTGKVISDSLISKDNVAQATSNLTANTLLRSDGAVKNIKDSVVSLSNLGVISGLTGLTSSGIIDLNTVSSFDLETTSNIANALNLQSSGGTTASQRIINNTGSALNSISIDSTAGGIKFDSFFGVDIASGGFSVSSGGVYFSPTGSITFNPVSAFFVQTTNNTANSLDLISSGGTSASQRILNSTGTAINSILIDSTVGGIQVDSEEGFNVASGGFAVGPSQEASFISLDSFSVTTASNLAFAINLRCSGGAIASQRMLNSTGTSVNSILLDSTLGGIQFDSASGVNVASGGFSVDNDGVDIDNINIVGNTISTTDTDGDLDIQADGTGIVRVKNSALFIDECFQHSTGAGVLETVIVNASGELGSVPLGYASYYFTGNSTNTNGFQNNYSIITGTRIAGLISGNFTVDTGTPDIEYTGTSNVNVRISVSANWSNEDNSNNFCRIGVHRNGTLEPNLEQRCNLSEGADYPRNVSLTGFITMGNSDKIDVRVLNEESSTDDILVSYFSLNIEIM